MYSLCDLSLSQRSYVPKPDVDPDILDRDFVVYPKQVEQSSRSFGLFGSCTLQIRVHPDVVCCCGGHSAAYRFCIAFVAERGLDRLASANK